MTRPCHNMSFIHPSSIGEEEEEEEEGEEEGKW